MLIKDKLLTLGWKGIKPSEFTNSDVTQPNLVIPRFHYLLQKAETIVADQAIEKFYAETAREQWEFEKHYKCVLPPFNIFFLETKRPSFIKSESGFTHGSLLSHSWGVLFQEISLHSGFTEIELTKIFSDLEIKYSKGFWLYHLNFAFDEPNRKDTFAIPDVAAYFLVDADGKIVKNPIIDVP